MNKKNMMRDFINEINDKKLMTKFIGDIFDYVDFKDYNYIFRMIDQEDEIIIDIYDNVSNNRFNRYIFSFIPSSEDAKITEKNNVFINYLNVINIEDCNNKLFKLAYLFKIDDDKMIDYAKTFLDNTFVSILIDIKNKPI